MHSIGGSAEQHSSRVGTEKQREGLEPRARNPMSTSSNDESCSEGCIKDTTLFPIFEPPKETMDWFLKVVNNGPDNNYSQTLKSSSWLNDSLKEEVRPLQWHIGNDGSCDATALAIAASKIFVVGRKFFNAYQLKELTCAFSDYWVFCLYGRVVH